MQNFWSNMPLGYYGPTHNSKTLEDGKVVGTSGVWCSIKWWWGLIGPILEHNWHLGRAPQHVTGLGVLFCHFFRLFFCMWEKHFGYGQFLFVMWIEYESMVGKRSGKKALHSGTGPGRIGDRLTEWWWLTVVGSLCSKWNGPGDIRYIESTHHCFKVATSGTANKTTRIPPKKKPAKVQE